MYGIDRNGHFKTSLTERREAYKVAKASRKAGQGQWPGFFVTSLYNS